MKYSSSGLSLLLLNDLATASSAAKVAPEPMSFDEKRASVGGDGARGPLRGSQTALTYKGRICRSETQGVMKCNTLGTSCQPDQWDYWLLNLAPGTTYTIEVDRVNCGLDPALSFFQGRGTTFPSGCFDAAGSAELALIDRADDNDMEPAYCSGAPSSPFADPKIVVTPTTNGPFTLAVVNYASDGSTCRATTGFQYKVKISPPPPCA